jgi:hypothetical protein
VINISPLVAKIPITEFESTGRGQNNGNTKKLSSITFCIGYIERTSVGNIECCSSGFFFFYNLWCSYQSIRDGAE